MKKKHLLKRVPSSLLDRWPYILLAITGILILGALLTFQLGSLLPGMSKPEAMHQLRLAGQSISIQRIMTDNPMYLPFSIGMYIFQLLDISSPVAIRGISVLFGFISAAAMFLVLHKWHTLRISVFMTALYASSAGFLHLARHGDVLSAYLLLPAILAVALYIRSIDSDLLRGFLLLTAGIISLFMPAMVWVGLIIGGFYYKQIFKYLKQFRSVAGAIYSAIGVSFVGLLAFSFIINSSNFMRWLGIPLDGLPTFQEYGLQLLSVPLTLFAWGPDDPLMWVGVAGVIDFFVGVLFVLGCYYYLKHRQLDRVKILFGSLFALTLAAGFDGAVSPFVLIPFVYIIAAAGMTLLLQQWFTVFPRNPFARSFAITLLVACIGITMFYNTHRYFVAWPRTPSVQATFQHQAE